MRSTVGCGCSWETSSDSFVQVGSCADQERFLVDGTCGGHYGMLKGRSSAASRPRGSAAHWWVGDKTGPRKVTNLCRLGGAQVKNGRCVDDVCGGHCGMSGNIVPPPVDRVGNAAHTKSAGLHANAFKLVFKDQLDCGGNDGGRPLQRHGRRWEGAVKAWGGSGGWAIMTGAVMRLAALGGFSLISLILGWVDHWYQSDFSWTSHCWNCSSSLLGQWWVGF